MTAFLAWRLVSYGISQYYLGQAAEGDAAAVDRALAWNPRQPDALYRKARTLPGHDPAESAKPVAAILRRKSGFFLALARARGSGARGGRGSPCRCAGRKVGRAHARQSTDSDRRRRLLGKQRRSRGCNVALVAGARREPQSFPRAVPDPAQAGRGVADGRPVQAPRRFSAILVGAVFRRDGSARAGSGNGPDASRFPPRGRGPPR